MPLWGSLRLRFVYCAVCPRLPSLLFGQVSPRMVNKVMKSPSGVLNGIKHWGGDRELKIAVLKKYNPRNELCFLPRNSVKLRFTRVTGRKQKCQQGLMTILKHIKVIKGHAYTPHILRSNFMCLQL